MNLPLGPVTINFSGVFAPSREPLGNPGRQVLLGVLTSLAMTGLATQVGDWISLEGALILYFLCTALNGYSFGLFASIASALGSVAGLNYFFTPPQHTPLVDSPQSWIALVGLLVVSLIVSALNVRLQIETASARTQRAQSSLARELLELLVGMESRAEIISAGVSRISSILNTPVDIISMRDIGSSETTLDRDTFRWCIRHGRPIGPLTDQGEHLNYWCIPLEAHGDEGTVLKVSTSWSPGQEPPEEARARLGLLRLLGQQLSLALDRERATRGQHEAQLQREQEAQRNVFLASISHDLRTPLATVLTSVGTLRKLFQGRLQPEEKVLIGRVEQEVEQTIQMAENVLTLAGISTVTPQTMGADWESLEEIIADVESRMRSRIAVAGAKLSISVSPGLAPLWANAGLLSKMLENLVNNSIQHSMTPARIEIHASQQDDGILVLLLDDGPGFSAKLLETREPDLSERSIDTQGGRRGFGLGLSIIRSIVRLHCGRLTIGDRPDSVPGSLVSIWLPLHP